MSKKEYKSITYVDRMNNPKHKCNVKVSHNDTYVVTEEKVFNEKVGRIVSKSSFKKVDKKPLKHFNVHDFSLENLQAIGAPLQPCSMKHDVNTATAIMEQNIQTFEENQTNI